MELTLEAVALFALKLVHEGDGDSPVLRDDPVMVGYDREAFGLLVRNGDLAGILAKVDECVGQALVAVGGVESVLGRELQKLATGVQGVDQLDELAAPLMTLEGYLKDIQ